MSWATTSMADPINYGDLGPDPPGVTRYLQVTESSTTDPVPPGRYGPPTLSVNTLDFDPTEFGASSAGGLPDITDVQLNYTLMTVPGAWANSMLITESGDFTLAGTGTDATQVVASLAVKVEILAVDGFSLAMPLDVPLMTDTFEANLADDGPAFGASWAASVPIDFESILIGEEIPFEFGVTKAKVVLDNTLLAFSEPSSIAFIAKKDFRIRPDVEIVPEPASLALMMVAIVGYGLAFRRRILRSIGIRPG